MKKSDVFDALVILTGMAFFILLILTIGGNYQYGKYAVLDLVSCIFFMKVAHDSHVKYRKGYVNRAIRERKLRVN